MIESLNCSSCGAPLDVSVAANFIKCHYCQSQLLIRRSGQTTFTEVAQRIEETSQRIEETSQTLQGNVESLSRNQTVADLDRQWSIEREEFYISGEGGHRTLPTERTAFISGVMAAVFGSFWTIMAFSITRNSPFGIIATLFPLFGLFFIGFGVFTSSHAYRKAKDFNVAHAQYKKQRQELIKRTTQNAER